MYRATVELSRQGHVVSYVQFPNADEPVLEEWQDTLAAETRLLDAVGPQAGELIFIGHSLGALNFLYAAQVDALQARFPTRSESSRWSSRAGCIWPPAMVGVLGLA